MKHRSTFTACEFSIVTQAIVNNLMPILFVIFKDDFGVSYTYIAALMLLNFMIQLVTDVCSVKIIGTFGYRKAGILAQLSAIVGLLGLAFLTLIMPIRPALLISTIFCAFGSGLLEVMVSPIVDSLDLGESSARMSMLHSFYCWGHVAVVILSTTAIYFFSNQVWRIIPIFWIIIPLISIILFTRVYIPSLEKKEEKRSFKSLFSSGLFAVMCVLMTCAGAAETTMAQWASLFAQKGLGVDKFTGDMLGPCLFAVLMGSGRLLQGLFGGRLNLRTTLIASSLLCTVCYLTASVSQNPYIALLGCALTGFSVSIMWPGVYSYSSAQIPGGGALMFGVLALFGDVGCSLGSWLCGAASDYSLTFTQVLDYAAKTGITPEQLGLKIGIGITAIFPIVMFLLLLTTKKKQFD